MQQLHSKVSYTLLMSSNGSEVSYKCFKLAKGKKLVNNLMQSEAAKEVSNVFSVLFGIE